MSSSKALKKKISKRAKQKKNIQVKNSIRLKNARQAEAAAVVAEDNTELVAAEVPSDTPTPVAEDAVAHKTTA
jgi:hypothetical protein